jgi:hypothetical protein
VSAVDLPWDLDRKPGIVLDLHCVALTDLDSLRNLDWFEVKEIRGNIEHGKAGWYQVTIDVGFRVLSPADLRQEWSDARRAKRA